jgi:hypothetical protein
MSITPSDSRHDLERAADGAAGGGFGDAIVRQHVGLALGGGRTVTAHGGEDEWARALRLPEIGCGARDDIDIANAAATYADRDPRTGGDLGGEGRAAELSGDGAADIGQLVAWEALLDHQHAWDHIAHYKE